MEINFPIKKIISLSPLLTKIIYDFGMENIIIGISENCPKGEIAKYKKQIINTTKNDNDTIIQRLSPDIIITDKIHYNMTNTHTIWTGKTNNIASTIRMMELLLEILPCQGKAEKLVDNIITITNSINDLSNIIWKDLYEKAVIQTQIAL